MKEPIAIIGMGCRYAGAENLSQFWNNLVNGKSCIVDPPASRSSHLLVGLKGGFIDHIDAFDADFFGVDHGEAALIDPQQRHLLEVTWHALEDAGYVPSSLAGTNTSVVIGLAGGEYDHLVMDRDHNPSITSHLGVHNAIIAGRLSQYFDFRGKSITINTACSSALIAIESACQDLWLNHSSLALVGAANLLFAPYISERLRNSRWLSTEGVCRSLDAEADGYVRSEGVAVIVLKPYSQARGDGDRIYALIADSSVGHNGRGNGLSLPSMQAQTDLLGRIYACPVGTVQAKSLVYVETNSVGAPLADVVELKSLGAAIGQQRPAGKPLRVGCLKPNIGHAEAASGMAGCIKVAMSLYKRKLPPTIRYKSTFEGLNLAKLGLQIQTSLEDIPAGIPVATAGVSSFGFGGANAHLLLQEAADNIKPSSTCHPVQFILLSARTAQALQVLVKRLLHFLEEESISCFADLCFTLNKKRHFFQYRLAIVAGSVQELVEQLKACLDRCQDPGHGLEHSIGFQASCLAKSGPGLVAFIFTGACRLAPQVYVYLRETYPLFRGFIGDCESIVQARFGMDLAAALSPQSSPSLITEELQAFLSEYLLLAIWKAWGIEPTHCIGDGLGHLAAAVAAGLLDVAHVIDWLKCADLSAPLPTIQQARKEFFSLQASVWIKPGDIDCIPSWNLQSSALPQVSSCLHSVPGLGSMAQIWLSGEWPDLASDCLHAPPSLPLSIEQLLLGLAAALKADMKLDLQRVGGYRHCQVVTLPPYPFEHTAFNLACSNRSLSILSTAPDALSDRPIPLPEPSRGVEEQLHALWGERLGVANFDFADNLLAMTGGSVIVEQLTQDIRASLGYPITVQEIIAHPTIASQASLLRWALRLDQASPGSTGIPPRPSLATQLSPRLPDEVEPVVDEYEALVAAAFATVMKLPRVGREANFFALGGDSLAAMRVMLMLEGQLGITLEPTLLFQHPTAASLAAWLRTSFQDPGLSFSTGAQPQPHAITVPAADALPGDWSSGGQAFGASFGQARLWFLHQLKPDLCAYHLPVLWCLQGRLDPAALESALTALVQRHPTLRTSFHSHGDTVAQILHPPARFHLPVDVLAGGDLDLVIERWLELERTTPFDLGSGQLLRARLLVVQEDHHLLLINHHHIASDGWSCTLLARDLGELYNEQLRGHASGLQPLLVHYQDYALWQRQRLSGDRLQMLTRYWISELSGLDPLDLPCDFPRPLMPSYRGGSVSFLAAPEILAPFVSLCRQEGATLQIGLLSLVALLLHRYSRQDDIAIGVPIWGRSHPAFESLIGCFVNTLPIRTRLHSQQTFRQFLRHLKATSLAAYDHHDLPFDQMVELLNIPRDTSRNPLVQVVLQLLTIESDSLPDMEGLSVTSLNPDGLETSCRFDLELMFRHTEGGGLKGQILYATDIFAAERIERLSAQLLTLLTAAAEDPDGAADGLNLLADAERQRIEPWQQGPRIDPPDLVVHQLFELQVQRTPEATALILDHQIPADTQINNQNFTIRQLTNHQCGVCQLTYQQLNERADHLAQQLIAFGVASETIVAVCLERSLELIVTLLAILKAGGAYLALDPSWPEARQQQLTTQAHCDLRIDGDGITRLQSVAAVSGPMAPQATVPQRLDRLPTRELANALGRPGTGPDASSPLAYITFTSGSTGVPKAVAIPHQAILRLVHPVNGFRLGPDSRVLQLAPVAFDASTFEIWGPLLQGGTLVIAPPRLLSTTEIGGLLRRHRISVLWLTAGLFHAMVDDALADLAGVSQVLAGGDVLAPDAVERLLQAFPAGHQLINGYGPTENTTFTCCHRLAAGERPGSAVPIGRPIAGTTVRVLDAAGLMCPIGVVGELFIGGMGLARGYWNDAERTAAAFVPDPYAEEPGARLYRSGDLVSWNPDGTLAFHGRRDGQIKLRGVRIEPGEIEAALATHPAVAQVAVVLRRDDPANPVLVAYWVPARAERTAELREFLNERLPAALVPGAFVALATLPLTPNGKLDRRALPAPWSGSETPGIRGAAGALEQRLIELWQEVLGHAPFGVDDHFFQVGGHSLAAARLAAAVEAALGRSLPVAEVFRHPTIREQAGWLRGGPPASAASHLVVLQPRGERPPLHVVHGWGGGLGHYIDLARVLGPHRPVFGLQAHAGAQETATPEPVTVLADRYAEQILARHPGGPIHLLGYSAAGWYAFAVAAALRQRGAPLGMLAVLDTHASARIHRRLGLVLLADTVLPRLGPQLRELALPPSGERRRRLLLRQSRSLNRTLYATLRLRLPGPERLAAALAGRPFPEAAEDPFVDNLRQGYRPPRLPLAVDLFAPPAHHRQLQRLWGFYAQGGVRLHPLFRAHSDFFRPALMPALAQALEQAMAPLEPDP